MHGARGAGDPAFGGAFDVVGVDVQADHAVTRRHTGGSGAGTQGFGQHHTHPAVQDAIRLARATVYRHAAFDEVVTHLGELHPQRGRGRVVVVGGEAFNRRGLFPDGHGGSKGKNKFVETIVNEYLRHKVTKNMAI